MSSPSTQPADPNAVIGYLFDGVAPEQKERLRELFLQHQPTFVVVRDKYGFTMEGGAFATVLFAQKTVAQFWLLGLASWRAFNANPILALSALMGSLEPELISSDDERYHEFLRLKHAALRLSNVENIEESEWPAEVPRPTSERDELPHSQQLIFDLTLIALAFAFLHEFAHVMFMGEKRLAPVDEEMACDRFALEIILSDVDHYAKYADEPRHLVRLKRGMGVLVAMFVLTAITPSKARLGSQSHPALPDRWMQLFDIVDPVDESFYAFAASLLVSMLIEEGKVPIGLPFEDPRKFCEQLLHHFAFGTTSVIR